MDLMFVSISLSACLSTNAGEPCLILSVVPCILLQCSIDCCQFLTITGTCGARQFSFSGNEFLHFG